MKTEKNGLIVKKRLRYLVRAPFIISKMPDTVIPSAPIVPMFATCDTVLDIAPTERSSVETAGLAFYENLLIGLKK